MLRAVKLNREYTITDADIANFVANGYDIMDGDKIIKHGAGKMVAHQTYQDTIDEKTELEAQVKKLTEKNSELEAQVKKLEAAAKKKE